MFGLNSQVAPNVCVNKCRENRSSCDIYHRQALLNVVVSRLSREIASYEIGRFQSQRSLGEDRQRRSLQGSAGLGGSACPVIDQDEVADQLENGQGDGDHGADAAAWPRRQGDRA